MDTASRTVTTLHIAMPAIVAAMLATSGCKPAQDVPVAPASSPTASTPATPSRAPAPIEYGTIISFTKTGQSEKYRTFGWSKTEDNFTWTEGQAAGLTMMIPAAEGAVSLRMRLAALIKPPELPFQPVQVFVNDRMITEWQVASTSEFTAPIPAEFTQTPGPLNIIFRLPSATSPKNLGAGEDPRTLGISCFEFELIKSS